VVSSRPIRVLLLALLASLFPVGSAQAEKWESDGSVSLGSGLQGGDPGTGTVAYARARMRLLAGVDLRYDESTSEGYGFYLAAELERRATFGGELRYQRWLSRTIGLHGAVLGSIAPETLVGLGVGARFGIPLARHVTLFWEPGFAAFPLGSDLPEQSVLVWFTLAGGVSVPF